MRINKKWLIFLSCIILMPGVQNSARGSSIAHPPLLAWLEPEQPITKNAPLTIHLTFALDPYFNDMITADTGSFSVGFTGSQENGRQTYPVTFERTTAFLDIMGKMFPDYTPRGVETTSLSYSGTFQIVVPDTTISHFSLEMHCGKAKATAGYYFIEADDTIGFYGNYPIDPRIRHKYDVVNTESRSSKIDRDTLTPEQLQTEYEIYIDLHDSSDMRIAQEILGTIPDSTICDRKRGIYKLKIPLENIFKIAEQNLEADFVTPPRWSSEYKTRQASRQITGKIDRDTLTQEQWQTNIEMAVELHGDEQLRTAQEILGPIPDTCRVLGQEGRYVIDMTLEQAFKLHDLGIGLEDARGKYLMKQKSGGDTNGLNKIRRR